MDVRRQDGLRRFRDLLPGLIDDDATEVRDGGGFADEIGDLVVDNVFGALWARPGLDPRSRSLVTLGILIALRASDELAVHLTIALRNGLTRGELEEVVYHSSAYAGFPAASTARAIAVAALRPPD